jgi:hypothetical protein
MLSFLQREYDVLHEKGGKPPKLTVEDKVCITLKYLREYRRMYRIAAEYGVCKGTVCPIQWVEDTLTEDGTFALPGKKIGLNSVRRRCYRKSDKSPSKGSKSVLFRKKRAYPEDAGHH